MTLKELKLDILNKRISFDMIIFLYEGTSFLVNSYINKIRDNKDLTIININNLNEIYSIESNVFEDSTNNLYVLDTDTFDDDLSKYNFHNLIIKTKKVTNSNSNKYVVKFEKPVDWQIEEYVKVSAPGLDEAQRMWLCDVANHDINRLDLECKKINIFDVEDQKNIFDELNNDNMYEDLNSLTIFSFTNAIIRHDKIKAAEILKEIKNIDIEPVGLVTILYKNFKNILNIQMNSKATPELLGISSKQFNAIKRSCNVYNNDKLIKIFNLLTTIDYKLKSGLLDNNKIIEYLIVNIM